MSKTLSSETLQQLHKAAAEHNLSADAYLEYLLQKAETDNKQFPYSTHMLLEHVADAIVSTDPKLKITAWNKAAERIYGWAEAEALGQEIDILLETEWINESQEHAQSALLETGAWSGEIRQQTKDGKILDIWASVTFIKDAQGTISGGITINRDITERKQIENAFVENSTLFEASLTAINQPFAIIDANTYDIIIANEAYGGLNAVGKKCHQVSHHLEAPCSSDEHPCPLQKIRESKQAYSTQHIHFDAEGNPRDIEVNAYPIYDNQGNLVQIVENCIDVTERNKTERLLRESEARYRSMFEKNQAVKLLIDSETGLIVDVNTAAIEFYGYPRETLLTMKIQDINMLSEEEVKAEMALARSEKRQVFHFRHCLANEDIRDVQVFSGPLNIQDKQYLYSVILDITTQKQAEKALQESEARLRSLLESQTAYVIRTDLEGNYIYINPAFFEKFGWQYLQADKTPNTSFALTIAPEDQELLTDAMNKCIQNPGKVVSLILRQLEQNNIALIAWEFIAITDSEDQVHELQCIGIDITELMEAREQVEIQQTALQATANSVVITDNEGIIQWVNKAFTELTGYTFEETIGQTTNILKSGVHDEVFYQKLWDTVRTGKVWQGRIINKRKDGAIYTEEQTITPVYDNSKKISHFIAIKQDVSERVQAEKIQIEQERLKARLQKEQELNVLIQQAVSSISHDIRTPLAVIKTSQDTLSQYFDRLSETKRREKLSTIGKQLQYIVQMLDDMSLTVKSGLNYHRFQEKTVNIVSLCHISLEEVKTVQTNPPKMSFTNHTSIENILGDEILITRILLNLLSNAVKYTPADGEIQLELEQTKEQIIIRVSDTGMGISKDDIPHLFEPFFRVDSDSVRSIKGTGLGLNIVKDCVERHNGKISVESVLGEGSTFTVELPLKADELNPQLNKI